MRPFQQFGFTPWMVKMRSDQVIRLVSMSQSQPETEATPDPSRFAGEPQQVTATLRATETADGVTTDDITFDGGEIGETEAYLVAPADGGQTGQQGRKHRPERVPLRDHHGGVGYAMGDRRYRDCRKRSHARGDSGQAASDSRRYRRARGSPLRRSASPMK